MKVVSLSGGEQVPALGQGTWMMGERRAARSDETAALQAGVDLGMKRLNTDIIDLYLLHWRGSMPLEETVSAMEALVTAGKVRHWGVSNLDIDDMVELAAAGGGSPTASNVIEAPGVAGTVPLEGTSVVSRAARAMRPHEM